MYEEAEDVEVLAWFTWSALGSPAISVTLSFVDDCESETEGGEWLVEEG